MDPVLHSPGVFEHLKPFLFFVFYLFFIYFYFFVFAAILFTVPLSGNTWRARMCKITSHSVPLFSCLCVEHRLIANASPISYCFITMGYR